MFPTTMKSSAMRTLSRTVVSLGVATVICLVAGCSSGNTTPGVTFGQVKNGSHDNAAPMQPHWTTTAKGAVLLHLYGSSSCPPKVEQVKQEGSTLRVTLHKYSGACTADYGGPYMWKVSGLAKEPRKITIFTGLNDKGYLLKRTT